MKKFQSGFTLVELAIVAAFFAACGFGGFVIYVLAHFLAKVW